MSLFNLFEDMLGRMNYLDNALGYINRLTSPSKGGRLGPVVKITFKRIDRGGNYSMKEVAGHLYKYGVPSFHHGYDHQHRWLYVRKTQEGWAKKLFDGEKLWTPGSSWREQKRKRKVRRK